MINKNNNLLEIYLGKKNRFPSLNFIHNFHFSEIHGNEIRKLELECVQLSQIKSSLDNQLLTINEKTKILSHKIQHLMDVTLTSNKPLSSESNSDDTNNLLVIALDSIEQIDSIINKNLHLFNGDQDLLKKKSDEQENFINKIKQDNNVLMKQCNDSQTLFNKTHDNLVRINRIKCNSFVYSLFR